MTPQELLKQYSDLLVQYIRDHISEGYSEQLLTEAVEYATQQTAKLSENSSS